MSPMATHCTARWLAATEGRIWMREVSLLRLMPMGR